MLCIIVVLWCRFLEMFCVLFCELVGIDYLIVKVLISNFFSSSLVNVNMIVDYKILFCCLIFVDWISLYKECKYFIVGMVFLMKFYGGESISWCCK